jgi:hypothetical protein
VDERKRVGDTGDKEYNDGEEDMKSVQKRMIYLQARVPAR